jgi:PAS domain S-box-containing protein
LELRASEENYRLLFETNPHPMWVYETETLRFLAVNQAAIAHYGFTRDEFLSMTLREVRPSEEVPALLAALWNERGRDQRRLKTVHRKKSGELIDVEIISHRLPHGGRPARLVVANDITEHLRLEEQFRQAQKMEAVGHLAGGIAHDFNNLLTVITGYSDLLLGRAAEAAPERRPLAEIAAAAARAAELTRQLLAFSRRQALRPRVLDLNALVSRVQSFLERLLGEHIQLETRLSPGAWPVRVDPAQMEQVIVNLAVNARDAMPDGGRLTLSTANITANGRHYVSLEVCDTGCGMDAATRAHIFEPFFTTKGPNKGTGLGLPTAQGIILQSGGSIDVESEPGQGTTIRISLPRVNAALDVDEIPEVVPRGGRETILLVEDQDAVRKLARRTLEEYGYHVLEAASAAEALELAQGTPERIHLAVTDVVMPGMSGREMVERLMMQRPGLLALFISGYSSDLLAPEGELVPGIRFLQKPFTPAALALKVRCVLDAGRASG